MKKIFALLILTTSVWADPPKDDRDNERLEKLYRSVFFTPIDKSSLTELDEDTIVDLQIFEEFRNRYQKAITDALSLDPKVRTEFKVDWKKPFYDEWLEFVSSTQISDPSVRNISLVNTDIQSYTQSPRFVEMDPRDKTFRILNKQSKFRLNYQDFEKLNFKTLAYLLSKKDASLCPAIENTMNAIHLITEGIVNEEGIGRCDEVLLLYFVNLGISYPELHKCQNIKPIKFNLGIATHPAVNKQDGNEYDKKMLTASSIYGTIIYKLKKSKVEWRNPPHSCKKDSSELISTWSKEFKAGL